MLSKQEVKVYQIFQTVKNCVAILILSCNQFYKVECVIEGSGILKIKKAWDKDAQQKL